MTQRTNPWLMLPVTDEDEAYARQLRSQRDRRYVNVFRARQTDERWVGELGELMLHRWMLAQGLDARWIVQDAAGKPDLLLPDGTRIGVKTVKRQGAPAPHYTAQITKRHAHEPVDFFVFLSYDLPRREMYVLGAIEAARFLREARFYGPGEQVHANYTVRPGHAIYNIEIARLTLIEDWLDARQGHHSTAALMGGQRQLAPEQHAAI